MKLCTYPSCENYIEGNTEMCASHNSELRKLSKQLLKEPKKLARIAKVSEKKAEKLKPYAVLRRNYLKENPVCEVHLPGCTGNSEEIHHCSESELDFLEITTWKGVCRPCHNVIERVLTSEERRKLGLLIDPVNTKWTEPHKI